MSSRASRAQARAQRAPTNPPIKAPDEPNPFPADQEDLGNYAKYQDTDSFVNMSSRIGVSQAGSNHLVSDDLDTMEVLVTQYKDNIKDFHTYLKTINKGARNAENPVRFSPVIMDCILAVMHHYIQNVTCFHMIPDMIKLTGIMQWR